MTHSSDRAREIAENNTILRTQVGSGLHGVTVSHQDDRDEMGICIEPAECVIGLERVPVINKRGRVSWQVFEQYEYRTQPEGVRSGPGDLDLTIYSLRKWAKLAAQGNPTVLLPLFVPESEIVEVNWQGRQLLEPETRDLFLSKECGRRFIGYLDNQRDCMMGLKPQRTNRPELIAEMGFDGKYAYHAVRLGMQGVELLSTGGITLPIPEPDRTWLKNLRIGTYTKQDALDRIAAHRAELEALMATTPLPDRPDPREIDCWLIEMYQSYWG